MPRVSKLTMSKDGTPRLDVNVQARLSLYDIAEILVAYHHYEHDFMNVIMSLNKTEIMNVVKTHILIDGTESVQFVIGDNDLNDHVTEIKEHLIELWK